MTHLEYPLSLFECSFRCTVSFWMVWWRGIVMKVPTLWKLLKFLASILRTIVSYHHLRDSLPTKIFFVCKIVDSASVSFSCYKSHYFERLSTTTKQTSFFTLKRSVPTICHLLFGIGWLCMVSLGWSGLASWHIEQLSQRSLISWSIDGQYNVSLASLMHPCAPRWAECVFSNIGGRIAVGMSTLVPL